MTALVLLVVCSLVQGASVCRDSVMYWDDGQHDYLADSYGGIAGSRLAVGFDKPGWARSVTEVHFYMTAVYGPWPDDPSIPRPDTTYAFIAHVWGPDGVDPNRPGESVTSVFVPSGDPLESWVTVAFPSPVEIAEDWLTFYVGLEWIHRMLPPLGRDETPPTYERSLMAYFETWEVLSGDAMVRATVSDEPGTTAFEESWSRIKVFFR